MADPIDIQTMVRAKLLALLDSFKAKAADGKISFAEGWQLLQEFTAGAVYIVDELTVAGADKKAMVLSLAQQFYDNVIAPIDIPFVPNILMEPALDRLLGSLIQPMLGAMIEASLNILRSGMTLAKKPADTGSAPS